MNNRPFYCYLDHFNEVTIIVPMKNYRDNNHYRLIGDDEEIEITVREKINLGAEVKLICSFDAYIHLERLYRIENEEGQTSELYTGKIVRTELFDNIYRTKKQDLGFTYQKEATKFKLWSPVAKSVKLELVYPNQSVRFLEMPYTTQGVWRLIVDGDLELCQYRFHVYVNGEERVVRDLYGIASTANAEYNVVIDKTKTYTMKHSFQFSGDPLDAIIYETSIRDFTNDPKVSFQHRSQYLGMVESGVTTPNNHAAGIDYLKKLGITHVQLMPFYDFDGVDELEQNKLYNWGYNPVQYFVPEGWFSSNPNDPYARINECKEMIDKFHEAGIGVIMDVVYNHVYDVHTFPFELLVPGYAYHVDRQGIYTNVSGCKNDLATHQKMVRKLILDSILYWVNEFHVDGFRFDLMGLIDVETMNEVRQELQAVSKHILVYGEGWKMYSSNQADRMAHMFNKNVLYNIGFFNDQFREVIKGSTFEHQGRGYTTGYGLQAEKVKNLILGSAYNRSMFKYTSQSINYVECHDNHTFYDKALHIENNPSLVKQQQLLATSLVILSQGVPFLHSGQECFRTKKGVENSYDSGDEINRFDWALVDEHQSEIEAVRTWIALRKQESSFKLKSTSELNQAAEVIVLGSKSILYTLNNGHQTMILFKPTMDTETMIIPSDYRLLHSTSETVYDKASQSYHLSGIGTTIFQK